MTTIPGYIEVPTDDPNDPFFRNISRATICELKQSISLHALRVLAAQDDLNTLTMMLERRLADGAKDGDLVCAPGSWLELVYA